MKIRLRVQIKCVHDNFPDLRYNNMDDVMFLCSQWSIQHLTVRVTVNQLQSTVSKIQLLLQRKVMRMFRR